MLDDLTDRLHIAYLGHDAYRAEQLGYWEVDRGVFELITPRQEVTDIVEQRLPLALRGDGDSRSVPAYDPADHAADFGPPLANGAGPGAPVAPAGPGAGQSGPGPAATGQSRVSIPAVDEPPLPLEAEAMRAATAAARRAKKNQPKHGAAITPAGAAAPGRAAGSGRPGRRLAEAPAAGPAAGLAAGPAAGLAAGPPGSRPDPQPGSRPDPQPGSRPDPQPGWQAGWQSLRLRLRRQQRLCRSLRPASRSRPGP